MQLYHSCLSTELDLEESMICIRSLSTSSGLAGGDGIELRLTGVADEFSAPSPSTPSSSPPPKLMLRGDAVKSRSKMGCCVSRCMEDPKLDGKESGIKGCLRTGGTRPRYVVMDNGSVDDTRLASAGVATPRLLAREMVLLLDNEGVESEWSGTAVTVEGKNVYACRLREFRVGSSSSSSSSS
jgi:hypothetical protein